MRRRQLRAWWFRCWERAYGLRDLEAGGRLPDCPAPRGAWVGLQTAVWLLIFGALWGWLVASWIGG